MTGEVWRQQLHAYLALRRALGFAMRPQARLLPDFVTYLERQGDRTSVAQIAVEWATAAPGANHARRLRVTRHIECFYHLKDKGLPCFGLWNFGLRLSIVRGFLTMARAADPSIDVPATGRGAEGAPRGVHRRPRPGRDSRTAGP